MKIYFAVSMRGGRNLLPLYKKVAELIHSRGHEITNAHVVDDLVFDRENKMTPDEIYKRDMQWMDESDIVIAEVTTASLGVGYELGRAIENNKKVYCLYDLGCENAISMMVRGNKKIKVMSYTTDAKCLARVEEILS